MFIFFYTCIAQLTSVKYEQLGMSQKSEALRASSKSLSVERFKIE
jgi:hypothetical protein